MTVEEIIMNERKRRSENGIFGIRACKKSILEWQECHNCSLYILLEEYVNRANKDPLFNKAMVLACWELINEEIEMPSQFEEETTETEL